MNNNVNLVTNGVDNKLTGVVMDNKPIYDDRSFVISGDWLGSLKQKMEDSSMNSKIWGAELADGAWDYEAQEATFQVMSYYSGDSNGNINTMRVFNNGNKLITKIVQNRFLRFPVTRFTYTNNSIGCKGGGTKLTIFRVGVFTHIWSYDENNQPYRAKLTFCSDDNGKVEIDFDDKNFNTSKYRDEVRSIRVDIENIEIHNLPTEMHRYGPNRGVGYEVKWFNDSDVIFDQKKLLKWLSIRYSQVRNFKIYFEVKSNDGKDERKIIPRTHFSMMKDGRVVYEYTDLNKDNQLIDIDGYKFELYYGCRIAPNLDYQNKQMLDSMTKDEFPVRTLKSGIRTDVPLILHLNHTDIVSFVENFGSTAYDTDTSWMLYVLKPLQSINDFYAVNKSDGYSKEIFGKRLTQAVKDRIKQLKLKNNYANLSKKIEDSEVVQFINYVTNPNSTEIVKDFKSLLKLKDKKLFTSKKNWIKFKRDDSDREVDARNEKVHTWFEFQASTENADKPHLDGIGTRINLMGRKDSPCKNFIWVAKTHNLRKELIEVLKGFVWENNHIENIFLLESNNVMTSFDADEVSTINIEKDVKCNTSSGFDSFI